MEPDLSSKTPALDYLLKEVSFSTCSNEFFGELEKEMLIPNNVNIYGRVKNADSIKDYSLQVKFSGETGVGYVKKPVSNTVEGKDRVLTYKLDDLVNYEDYWWFPLKKETEFMLRLNLLPPFPNLNPVDMAISCRPDIIVGTKASVTTRIQLKARENVDQVFLRLSNQIRLGPGIDITLTRFSGDNNTEPRHQITYPEKAYPFPTVGLKAGQALDFDVDSTINADPRSLVFLRCEQDVINTKLLMLSDSTPSAAPCAITLLDENGEELPINKTVRSTVLQATGQVMYSPFSLSQKPASEPAKIVVPATPH